MLGTGITIRPTEWKFLKTKGQMWKRTADVHEQPKVVENALVANYFMRLAMPNEV